NIRRPSLSGDAVESWVGRYGTLVAAALVILLGVGTLVVWAVQRGLLSPGLRVAGGVATTACVAAAGLHFRRKGERRYGNVLLALAPLVLVGGIRASREPTWRRAPVLLVVGAALYELAAAGLPTVAEWYGPFLIPLFGGALALGALALADLDWRGILARAFLAA